METKQDIVGSRYYFIRKRWPKIWLEMYLQGCLKKLKTKDITGGLPRVAELFEARRPKIGNYC